MKFAGLLLGAALTALGAGAACAQQIPSAIVTTQVSVAATATLVANVRRTRKLISIENLGTTQIFCGPDASVSLTTGYAIAGVAGATLAIDSTAAIYCLASTGTQSVSVLETIQ